MKIRLLSQKKLLATSPLIADREEAIKKALSLTSAEGDAVILAGKGADAYQIINDQKVPYPGDYALAEKYI